MMFVQYGYLFLLFGDVGGQRLLHELEVLVELTYLIVAIHIGDGLIVVPVCNALCRLREICQRL